MKQANQKGSALVLTMILVAVLSVITVSMMFLSQSETWSTHNYRLMNQARDAAEAGLNRAANFIINSYVPPEEGSATDPLTDYDRTVYPVTDVAGVPIVLSAHPDMEGNENYPYGQVVTDFDAASQGYLTMGTVAVDYNSYASLLSMREVDVFAVGPKVLQSWELTSEGSISGIQGASVEVAAILDRTTFPTFGYAAFGVSEGCDPTGLEFGGDTLTNSYDSRDYNPNPLTGGGGAPSVTNGSLESCENPDDACAGNLGTNGSMEVIGGTVDINGSLSSPRTGVGDCDDNAAVDNPDVLEEGLVELPQTIEYPDPLFPDPPPLLVNQTLPNNSSTCPLIPGCQPTSPAAKNQFVLTPGAYGNLSGGGGAAKVIYLEAGTYTINSLDLGSNVTVIPMGPVVLNITGCASLNADSSDCATYLDTPLSTSGGSFTNSSYDSSDLQIIYGGPGTLTLAGTSGLAAVVYAPSAHIDTFGTTDFYGSIIGDTVDFTGVSAIHYDRALEVEAVTMGPFMLRAFTWKKF